MLSLSRFHQILPCIFLVIFASCSKTKESIPKTEIVEATFILNEEDLPDYETYLDHAALISKESREFYHKGMLTYRNVCFNCHGNPDQMGSMPNSLKFWSEDFKHGTDPYSIYEILTRGYGMMAPQVQLTPKEKYAVINFIREEYIKELNPNQYFEVDSTYLASLPKGDTLGPEPQEYQPWAEMDYGDFLIQTYELSDENDPPRVISGGRSPLGNEDYRDLNFAYKGIAIRLDEEEPVPLKDFKVVGYLPSYRFYLNDKIEYDKLTHLNISFVNPDSMGLFSIPEDPTPIIERARQLNPNLQILFSIAGGALTEEWRYAYQEYKKTENRTDFIHNLMTFTRQYDVDGLDIDLEWQDVDENYSPFVIELSDSLFANNMSMTAALPPTTRFGNITDEALDRFEFINLMAYDEYGPWRPNNPGQHSSFAFAEAGINYWKLAQGLSNKKLTLGVPFYGYDFSDPSRTSSVAYGQMVAQDTTYTQLDQVDKIYYNGIPTIKTKLALARERVGGIMIWELGQDAFDEYADWSLLRNIFNELYLNTNTKKVVTSDINLNIYPNPFMETITLEASTLLQQFTLFDVSGRIVFQQNLNTNSITLVLSDLTKGTYFAVIETVEGRVVRNLVK